jgi:hypothetical protein
MEGLKEGEARLKSRQHERLGGDFNNRRVILALALNIDRDLDHNLNFKLVSMLNNTCLLKG